MRPALRLQLCLAFFIAGHPVPAEASDCGPVEGAAFNDAALHRRLDRRTRSVEHAGNDVELLVDGRESFALRAASAADAEVLLVKTFIFTDDEAGREVARLLSARAQAGALVILQYDAKGSAAGTAEILAMSGRDASDWPGDARIFQDMAAAGVIVIPTNIPRHERAAAHEGEHIAPLDDATADGFEWVDGFARARNFDHFDHEKVWITGRQDEGGLLRFEAILGGLNIASEYAYGGTEQVDGGTGRGGWRDTDVAVRGPVTADIVRRFFQVAEANLPGLEARVAFDQWDLTQPVVGEASVRFVWNQPAVANRRTIMRGYRSWTAATPPGSEVRLENAYFVPSPAYRRTLRRRLEAGTELSVITNGASSVDVPAIAGASRASFQELLRASPDAALYEWEPSSGHQTLHSKVASFGRCGPVVVGSANLDGLSGERNSESVVFIRDVQFRAAFDAMFEADMRQVRRVTPEVLAETPPLKRGWRRLVLVSAWRWL